MSWYDHTQYGKNKKLWNWDIFNPLSQGGKKMTNIKQKAEEYEPPKTLNIVDVERVLVDQEIVEQTFQDKDGKDFTVSVMEIEGKSYRVPTSVLKQLKAILKEKPDLTSFKVTKDGEGMQTSYTVIPLD